MGSTPATEIENVNSQTEAYLLCSVKMEARVMKPWARNIDDDMMSKSTRGAITYCEDLVFYHG